MGEVYRGHDSRLKRDVALKVLPPAFTRDADRLARFRREALLLASLNHPNIATIYGFEEFDGVSAIVMELIEGDTLADRIAQGPLSIGEALRLAGQVIAALEAAHDRGIIHRDLKPANIKIRADGTVKVLDFGLAKVVEPTSPDSVHVSASPTVTSPAITAAGVFLGTAAYISPEQAKGRPADKRSDIWSFGCVLYEMIAGARPFEGESVSESLALILTKEPDWSALLPGTPPSIQRLLRRTLAKDFRRRLADIADARIEIDDASRPDDAGSADVGRPARTHARTLVWVLSGALIVAIATVALFEVARPAATSPPVSRTAIVLPENTELDLGFRASPLAISPDGLRIVYVAETEGSKQLYRRELRDLDAAPLVGTVGARHPFFSPDGEWVAFFARGLLQKVSIHGGAPLAICPVEGISMGGAWGPDGTIVFATLDAGLFRIASTGGMPTRVAGSGEAVWPEILPDGKTVLYLHKNQIATIALGGGNRRILGRTDDVEGTQGLSLGPGTISSVRYLPTGHLVFGHGNFRMRAVPFDLASLTLRGSPASIVDSVYRSADGGPLYFAVSKTGVLVYAPEDPRRRLVWVDRDGRVTPIGSDREAFRYPAVSLDGRHIAVDINTEERRSDIWIYDADRGTRTRLTSERSSILPLWGIGREIIFHSTARGRGGINQQMPGGTESLIFAPKAGNIYPTSRSPDGHTVLFTDDNPTTGMDLWALPVGGTPRKLLASRFNEQWAHFSKDGRFITYASDESGNEEVFVADYPDMANRVVVSTGGGDWPVWSPDSREVFYRRGNDVMAAPVETVPVLRAGAPHRLFTGAYAGVDGDRKFDVAPDGRFLMIERVNASISQQLIVVQNWLEELKQRVPSH
jgi:eukaryotic-like serine/threonine-protein kinase